MINHLSGTAEKQVLDHIRKVSWVSLPQQFLCGFIVRQNLLRVRELRSERGLLADSAALMQVIMQLADRRMIRNRVVFLDGLLAEGGLLPADGLSFAHKFASHFLLLHII